MSTPGDFPTVDVPAALATALAERYRVDRLVGRGGMAAVYLAHDRKHDRDVAIKVLPPDVIASVGPERFLAEIRTTGQLKHPHILPLFDSGSSDSVLFAPDGSGERVVVDAQSGTMPQPTYAIWSADSATIYYKASDRDRHSSIWSVPVAGGTPRLLVRFDDPSRRSLRREFATDGQRFYFTIARDESDIWTAELQRK